jgi:hypothetical protein
MRRRGEGGRMKRSERLYTGSGICIYDATDLLGIERKRVKDRDGK